MSPRDSFWFLAGALVAVVIMVTLRAWLRERPAVAGRSAIPSFAVPIAAALALLGVALGVYFLLGSPQSIASSDAVASAQPLQQPTQSTAAAGSLEGVTNKLAARLAAKGGSESDWNLLAQSYEYMGRTAEAKAARAHVAPATPERMIVMADAFDRPTAAGTPPASPASVDASGNTPRHATGGTAEISGTVEIASELTSQVTSADTLYIYAKGPDVPGPPLAVLRLRAGHWPVSFTLNDANSMVPGRVLSGRDSVQIEARVSKSGTALAQSGDLVGTVTGVNPRSGHAVKIYIDRKIG